jgi:hypothetical protein
LCCTRNTAIEVAGNETTNIARHKQHKQLPLRRGLHKSPIKIGINTNSTNSGMHYGLHWRPASKSRGTWLVHQGHRTYDWSGVSTIHPHEIAPAQEPCSFPARHRVTLPLCASWTLSPITNYITI